MRKIIVLILSAFCFGCNLNIENICIQYSITGTGFAIVSIDNEIKTVKLPYYKKVNTQIFPPRYYIYNFKAQSSIPITATIKENEKIIFKQTGIYLEYILK